MTARPAQHQPDPEATLVALTVEEAARRIRVGRTTMYALIAAGEIATVTIGRLRRVPAEAVVEYVRTHTTPAITNQNEAA